jgi:hypothetical protein
MMSRKYLTSSTMLHDKYADKVIQPDLKLVDTLHKLLDMIPQDNLALTIDLCVADLIKFHNPRNVEQNSLAYPEIILRSNR